jgi:hypothetical protein
VAYAEKRGKGHGPWRFKYTLPGGTEVSESGFATKAAALAWGRDQEAKIRSGQWTDRAGKITVNEWIDRWLAMQDVGISTADNRAYLIRRFLQPAWGTSELKSLTTEAITRWENGLPRNRGRRTGRRLERTPQRAWATPLETLLLAEHGSSRHAPVRRAKPAQAGMARACH